MQTVQAHGAFARISAGDPESDVNPDDDELNDDFQDDDEADIDESDTMRNSQPDR